MCYYNSLHAKPGELSKRYGLKSEGIVEFCPIKFVKGFDFPVWPILTAQNPTDFQLGKWGLIPNWSQDLLSAEKLRTITLNARIETLDKKPSFRGAVQKRYRCLVPSTGFFEWQKQGKTKIPHFITLKNAKIFSMAGLWDEWVDSETGNQYITFTIITVPANPLMAKIHNQKERMPAILEPKNEKKWLDNSYLHSSINDLVYPIHESLLSAYPILPPMNACDKTFDELIRRVDYFEIGKQPTLF